MKKSNRHRAALLVALVLGLATIHAGAAQQSTPSRVRGTITQVKDDALSVRTPDGKILHITLAKDANVLSVVPARLADIKPGRFVGTAARPAGDKLTAIEVHLMPVGSRPGEGHRPWTREPGATMTNADVTAAIIHAKHGELTLATGGQRYVVMVPPGTPIFAMSPGTRKLLMRGAWVSFTRLTEENGVLTAKSITVSKDKRWPVK